jgi:hypothetical protein
MLRRDRPRIYNLSVVVQQPPVKHEVKMKDFVSWLGRQGRSPAEVLLKQKLEKVTGVEIRGVLNSARTLPGPALQYIGWISTGLWG